MKNKYLFLIFMIVSSSLSADILYIKKKRCILDDYYFQNNKFHYTYSSTRNQTSTTKFKASDLEYGYEYVDSKCQKLQVLKDTKMTYQNYKFMVALTGLLIGFLIFSFVIFVFIKKD